MDHQSLIARVRGSSPLKLALLAGGVLTLANLLPALARGSALLALLSVMIWFVAAGGLFATVTWLRKDDWVDAGFIVGLTPVVARLIVELITRDDLFLTAGPSIGLVVRALIAVPLSGGLVFGARWLTTLIRTIDTAPPPWI